MDTDRNLLFGVLALQADLLSPTQFVEACTLWASRKDIPISDVLAERGWLAPEDRADVERLLQRKLHKHGGDVKAGLAEATRDHARQSLAGVCDPDVQQSLAGLPGADELLAGSTLAYQPPRRDRYVLTRLHARGGIGQVWLAHDSGLGRDVALKELLPEGQDRAAVRARFLEEARVTGQLEHPGIVPVYELAQDSEGRTPFYTMRFIRGRTLQEAGRGYHQKREAGRAGPLDLRELLGAFAAVCNTVAYAHSRGVLHRDLKGQNVLLGDFGEVMVVDWGLAKRLEEFEADDGARLLPGEDAPGGQTVQGQVLGTPAYMAPEQAEGRLGQIDRRTDVYGLGAILYELLAGQPPFSGKETHEVLRRVVQEAPAPPRRLVPSAPPALEAICLKGMAKRPGERYPSARDLGREVERWLADEPVAAWREPWTRRLARWGRRHKPLLAAAAALLIAAVLALGAGLILQGRSNRLVEEQRDEARRQRDLARENFQMAREAVSTYLTRVSEEQLLDQPGLQPLRQNLLKSALGYYEAFVQQRGDDPALRGELAEAHRRLGDVTAEVGSKVAARESLGRAVALYEELHRADPEDPEVLAGLARSHHKLAYLQVFTDQPAEAGQSARSAIALLERLRAANGRVSEYGRLLGRSHDLLGISYTFSGRSAEAQDCGRQAVAILAETSRRAPADAEARRLLALAHNNLAMCLLYADRPALREEHLRQAITLHQGLVKEYPGNALFRSDLTHVEVQLGPAKHLIEQLVLTFSGGFAMEVASCTPPRSRPCAPSLRLCCL